MMFFLIYLTLDSHKERVKNNLDILRTFCVIALSLRNTDSRFYCASSKRTYRTKP
jgi:hypothetical protein